MIVLLNPRAGSGRAANRWNRISALFNRRFGPCTVVEIHDGLPISRCVRHVFDAGERLFVAAGGDGTVNALLNVLMTTLDHEEMREIVLGAVGLGSSNDFHKPSQPGSQIVDVPCCVCPDQASRRDIGVIAFPREKDMMTRYFVVNASVGLTAEANRLFNSPGRVLSLLKPFSTRLSIVYAAIRTLGGYTDSVVQVSWNGSTPTPVSLTNLAVLKSHHVSGTLRFPGTTGLNSGLFSVVLAEALSIGERLSLLAGLSRGQFGRRGDLRFWSTPTLEVCSATPFAVEYDGEVTTARNASFSLLPCHVKVCGPC